jgi:hypothetical protein
MLAFLQQLIPARRRTIWKILNSISRAKFRHSSLCANDAIHETADSLRELTSNPTLVATLHDAQTAHRTPTMATFSWIFSSFFNKSEEFFLLSFSIRRHWQRRPTKTWMKKVQQE